MGVVVTPYTYTDGSTLDPAQHNSNVFSATGDQGIQSEPNGGLDNTNLAVGFTVQPEHVWPGEIIRMTMESRLDSIDYMSDAFADSANSDDNGAYVTIAGVSCRFFLPYAVSVILWQWTVFAHCFRFRDGVVASAAVPAIRIRAAVDGAIVAHSRRTMPETAFDDNVALANNIIGRESRNARSWDMAHLNLSTAAGWHELDVRVYMELVNQPETVTRVVGDQTGDFNHQIHHRMTAGISNARALALL